MRPNRILSRVILIWSIILVPGVGFSNPTHYPTRQEIQERINVFDSTTYIAPESFDISELHRNFVFYPKYVFDTAEGRFDNAFSPKELAHLQSLWKQVRYVRGYPTGKNCGRLAFKADYVLKAPRFLHNHVIFLINEHRPVYQWDDIRQAPLDEGCACTQFLSDNPIVIRKDGAFGFSFLPGNDHEQETTNFNRMVGNESISLTTMEEAIQLADIYLNLTTKAKMITLDYLDEYIHRLYELHAYLHTSGDPVPPHPISELLDIPRVQFVKDQITITFHSWAGAAFAGPRSFVKWEMRLTLHGEIVSVVYERIL